MKIIPDTWKRYCQKGEIPEITQENTDEHAVGPDRVPGPGALSGRTRENFITTHQGGIQTDRQTGKISLVSPWALHASGRTRANFITTHQEGTQTDGQTDRRTDGQEKQAL